MVICSQAISIYKVEHMLHIKLDALEGHLTAYCFGEFEHSTHLCTEKYIIE